MRGRTWKLERITLHMNPGSSLCVLACVRACEQQLTTICRQQRGRAEVRTLITNICLPACLFPLLESVCVRVCACVMLYPLKPQLGTLCMGACQYIPNPGAALGLLTPNDTLCKHTCNIKKGGGGGGAAL